MTDSQKPIPLHFNLGGLPVRIHDLRRAPNVRAALADFLSELATEIRGEVKHDGEGQDQGEPEGDPAATAG